jgi:hypothetical protein
MGQKQLMNLAIAGGLLFAAYKFAPNATVKPRCWVWPASSPLSKSPT